MAQFEQPSECSNRDHLSHTFWLSVIIVITANTSSYVGNLLVSFHIFIPSVGGLNAARHIFFICTDKCLSGYLIKKFLLSQYSFHIYFSAVHCNLFTVTITRQNFTHLDFKTYLWYILNKMKVFITTRNSSNTLSTDVVNQTLLIHLSMPLALAVKTHYRTPLY